MDAHALSGRAAERSRAEDGRRTTRLLLLCGMLAGPLYLFVGLAQAMVREGFDLMRHPLSLLANGPGGWVQTANFVITGALVLAAAAGFARALRPSRAAAWSLAVFGAGMVAAAVFPADPVDGFPVGTPEGFPTSISTTGLLHFVAGALGFLALAISCFLAARPLSRRNARRLARFSVASGTGVLLGFFSGPVLPLGTLGIWFSVVVGWAWLGIVSYHLFSTVAEAERTVAAAS